jgi:hypothetical protein
LFYLDFTARQPITLRIQRKSAPKQGAASLPPIECFACTVVVAAHNNTAGTGKIQSFYLLGMITNFPAWKMVVTLSSIPVSTFRAIKKSDISDWSTVDRGRSLHNFIFSDFLPPLYCLFRVLLFNGCMAT